MAKEKSKRRIVKSAWHRNGISGVPFNVAIFEDEDGSFKLGVFFDSLRESSPGRLAAAEKCNPHIAVFHLGLLKDEVLTFGINSFRGDDYADVREMLEDAK